MRMRDQIISIAQMLRLPTRCLLCHGLYRGPFAVCVTCAKHLPLLGPSCQSCATPLPDTGFLLCGQCCLKKPAIDHVFTTYRFEEPLRTILHEFKYREGLYLASFLSKLMAQAIPVAYETECLIPVPMHPKQLRRRGFNQAALLAKHVARHIHCPVDNVSCQKILDTPHQAGLDAQARRQNLHQAFHVKAISYEHVTLVDDLLTTGSTANELARQLKRAGVKRVDLWCCAKACPL